MKVITRIQGGLGNQLFCYAAARRLALTNNAELVIDDVTGFARDKQYRREYALEHFSIPARKATSSERLEPFERYRRGINKWLSRRKPFSERYYIEQEGVNFDNRLLDLKVNDCRYLDGLWQGEGYFKDIEEIIRGDLKIIPPNDTLNLKMADEICSSNSVALHVRWFNSLGDDETHNVSVEYYNNAISMIDREFESPRYFLFSDDVDAAREKLKLTSKDVVYISHNKGEKNAYADLWLMQQCKNFIIANSTFSWWGAWLSEANQKTVITPDIIADGKSAWGFHGLIPAEWVKIKPI